MNKTATGLDNAKIPVFETGDYVQLTCAQDRHLPIGTVAMVNERFTDGIDFRRDAYIVTFDNDSGIVGVQDLASAKASQAPLIPSKEADRSHSKAKQDTSFPPVLKRTIEGENSLLAESSNKKLKTDFVKTPDNKRGRIQKIDKLATQSKGLAEPSKRKQKMPIK